MKKEKLNPNRVQSSLLTLPKCERRRRSQQFLFQLLMAIVMIGMCPMKIWADVNIFEMGANYIGIIPAVPTEILDIKPEDFNLYKFTAPHDGTITIIDNADMNQDDTYGVVFSANNQLLYVNDNGGNYNRFKISELEVTKDAVYWIGVRMYLKNTASSNNHTITITGT